jgi:outer membrane lipase/esterase
MPREGEVLVARLRCAVTAVLALFCLLSPPTAAFAFSNLYVFGDSLVDAGNTRDLVLSLGGTNPTPPASGYYDGRFTNGITFADVFNIAIEGVQSDNSLSGGDNFAFGGARARNDSAGVPDLAAQVGFFNTAHPTADPNALYLINVGGNDIFDILSNPSQAATIMSAAAAAISTSVLTLQGLGAQHILVMGVGDVGSPPSANGFEVQGRAASISLNNAILGVLPAGASWINTIAFFDQVSANPTAYGLPAGLLTEVSCLTGGGADPGGPPTCNNYTFFDNTHPTTQVSQVLGNALVAFVPEPGTGMLVAFGVVAMAIRRRRGVA